MTKRLPALALLCALAAPPMARAQDDFPVMDWGPIIQTEAMNSVIEEIGRSEARRAGLPYPGDRPASASNAPVRSRLSRAFGDQLNNGGSSAVAAAHAGYTPSPAVRRELADVLGGAAATQNPAAGDEMRQLVQSGRAVAEYQRVADALGFRVDDAIDAFAFYLLAQWGVANDHRGIITPAQAAGVRRQAAAAYASVADQLTTDALRQEFAETLVVQAVILAGVHEAAARSGDDALIGRYAALARRGGQMIFSIDPARITLTDAGFQRR